MKEILAIIPVRGGSKGIPGKNIKLLAGRPLVAYSIDAAKNSKYVTRTIVSTEKDETKTAPVLFQVLDYLKQHENYEPDIVVLLQATCPLRDSKELDDAFDVFFKHEPEGCDSVFSARMVGVTHALWRQNPDTGDYEALYDYRHRPRRQDTDRHFPLLRETGATYIIKTQVMKEVKDFIGKNPRVYFDGACIDIDTEADFEKAADLIKQRQVQKHRA